VAEISVGGKHCLPNPSKGLAGGAGSAIGGEKPAVTLPESAATFRPAAVHGRKAAVHLPKAAAPFGKVTVHGRKVTVTLRPAVVTFEKVTVAFRPAAVGFALFSPKNWVFSLKNADWRTFM